MPTISRFYGIMIRMYFNEHGSPHFHALYGEHAAVIAIESFELLEGSLPRRVMGLVLEWASQHRQELRDNWNRARRHELPLAVAPLE